MRKYAMQQYQLMQQDIEICKTKRFNEEKEIECCYQICNKYWRQIQNQLSVHHFSDDEEEIDFFKNLKPMFTSEIEFYNLLYHAHLFQPLYGLEDTNGFWQREALRLGRFIESNAEFYDYYTNTHNDLDSFYFLRSNYSAEQAAEQGHTETDRLTGTSHDHLVAELLALQKYNAYVQSQINRIKTP